MRLIGLVVVLALGLVLAPPTATQEANSQPSKKIPVVGILHPGAPDPTFPSVAALREGLNALGYVEGQNIRLKERSDALIQLSSPLIGRASRVVAEFTRKNRLPRPRCFGCSWRVGA
jgi:hypothetical protein